ncbi:D-apionate lactonase [Paraburkholderia sp. GAS82]|uniref:D-apionate lactonase n=1 Tax=Paraburkholderia sp. GAS82 TaxID=3035137 RepID=UPI003D1EDD0A
MNGAATLAGFLYGTAQPQPEERLLRAGPWSALLVDGALRDIRFGGIEVIRSIAYVVRDKDWGTSTPQTSGMKIDQDANAFRVSYTALCANPDGQRIAYDATIQCDASGTLSYRATSTAASDFLTARCGFCVLHPIDGVAGAPARVEHNDGSVEDSTFPELIDPWQPFKDIGAIEHRLACGLSIRVALTGDTFEMEDQRNWSDASFKTYSRPLELPWPYVIEAGTRNEQAVELRVTRVGSGVAASVTARPEEGEGVDEASVIELAAGSESMPALGIAIAPDEVDNALANLDLLAQLGPQQLSLHFDPLAGHGAHELTRFAQLQRACAISAVLECALPGVAAPLQELETIAAQIREAGLTLGGIVVSPAVHRQSNPPGSQSSYCPPLDEVYLAARRVFPALRLGGGMLSYFTELNRKRPPLTLVDWVTHATCPIVHAADDRSVMQTLEAIPHITRSCRTLIGAQAYAIGPVSLGMRQNPYGSRVMPNPHRQRIAMACEDPRQHAQFGAAWLAGYAAALAGAGLECFTLGALTGPRGLASTAEETRRYPIFPVAQALARMAGKTRLICHVSHPRELACVAVRDERGNLEGMLANLTSQPRTVRVIGGKIALFELGPFDCVQFE